MMLAAACGGGAGGVDGGGMVPGGPSVVSLDVSPGQLTAAQSATVTAQVTDPDGTTDILGGVLRAGANGPQLATFQLVSGGTFTAMVSWDGIHQATSVAAPDPVTLRAEFTDSTGKVGWREAQLGLTCAGNTDCAGACVDTSTANDNCGACGRGCTQYQVSQGLVLGGCSAGNCTPTYSACFSSDAFSTCDQVCASQGETCVAGGCLGETVVYYGSDIACSELNGQASKNVACNSVLETQLGLNAQCCCTDSGS